MGPSFGKFSGKSEHPPTFKKPLKPPLLLFEFFVQSEPTRCSWVLAHTHEWNARNIFSCME